MSTVADRVIPSVGAAYAAPVSSFEYDAATLLDQLMRQYETTVTRPTVVLRSQFDALANRWRADTLPVTNPQTIREHPAFVQIAALGSQILPFVFERLDAEPKLWLIALPAITDADPDRRQHYGHINKMISDWKRWWRERR